MEMPFVHVGDVVLFSQGVDDENWMPLIVTSVNVHRQPTPEGMVINFKTIDGALVAKTEGTHGGAHMYGRSGVRYHADPDCLDITFRNSIANNPSTGIFKLSPTTEALLSVLKPFLKPPKLRTAELVKV